MIVVEPVLTEEKLRLLLREGHEQPELDYKTQLNLAETRDVVELAKDVAAMMAEDNGGYIVVGADDAGKPVPNLTDDLAKLFDEATVRPKLAKYIVEPFAVRVARKVIDGCNLALIYVAPHVEAWCIFKAPGTYPDGKYQKVVFSPGDVFVRHGTSSERWNEADRKRLLGRAVSLHKEAWRAEQREEVMALITASIGASQLQQGPSSVMTWRLDAETFDQLALELMRSGDDVPIKQMLLRATADATPLLSSEVAEFPTLLDRVVSIGALALTYERDRWFQQALEVLVKIYGKVHKVQNPADTARAWLQIICRVYGLGALAVRLEQWPAVRRIANQQADGRDFQHHRSWLRHALTMASRAQVINVGQNGLIDGARNVVRDVVTLRPDLESESDEVLDSLCQFDALAILSIVGEAHRVNTSDFYTNFARYYEHRTQPAFSLIVRDQAMRQAIFAGDDELLAEAIVVIDGLAQKEGFDAGYDGIDDVSVAKFIKENT